MAKQVLLYKTFSCPWCHKTAEFLDKHKIKYKAIDVGEDEKAAEKMVEISGQRGVPVIDIDGKIIVGFDEPKLKKLLRIK
ncbi:MAG: glutaredoxin domain-containing protein [Nanoarchaeota archaeon]